MVLGGAGCATTGRRQLEQTIAIRSLYPPLTMTCRDGEPVRVLVGQTCSLGVCGWSCEADRWK